MKIQSIDDKSPYLQEVIRLGDKNRKTLGFLPDKAFTESAKKQEILIAIDSEAEFAGYLLFRTSYNRITIVHLCIAPSHRGKGITKKLIDKLKKITQDKYEGIGLSCRNDYGLDNMWSGNGFIPKWEKPGRGKDGKMLTYWWYDYGHPNLFSIAPIQKLESKLCVVIDDRVFLDLYADDDEYLDKNESKLLLADWLEPELELCITDGIFIQINNINSDEERKLHRQFAQNQQFTVLTCQSEKLGNYQEKLKTFLSQKGILKSELDIHHFARAIASDSNIFVTRNSRLLDIANEIYENFKLSVIRPINLIIQLNELGRNPEYQPIRLAGTSLEQVPVKKGEEETITNYFYCSEKDETKAQFQQKLRRFLTYPEDFECFKVIEKEDKPLALIVYGRHNNYELEIPIIRVSNNPLSATLVQHLIFKSVLRSAREGRDFTIINDSCLQDTVYKAIESHRFIRVNNDFFKINLAVMETASQLSKRLKKIENSLKKEYHLSLELANSINKDNFIQD
ncbi:MAG: GNAT family N-acetyltransferase, partial [Rivularia sp. (in: cyanobacteria)]